MAIGANLVAGGSQRALWGKASKLLLKKASSLKFNFKRRILSKAGVPATDTAADDPGGVGVFIVDTTNNHVYVCSAYTSSSVFTIVQIA